MVLSTWDLFPDLLGFQSQGPKIDTGVLDYVSAKNVSAPMPGLEHTSIGAIYSFWGPPWNLWVAFIIGG